MNKVSSTMNKVSSIMTIKNVKEVIEPCKAFANEFYSKYGITTPLLAVIVILLLFIWRWMTRASYGIPDSGRPLPGPRGLPIIGYLPILKSDMCDVVSKLKERYGDIFAVPIGMQKFVFLNSFDSIFEALVNQQERFAGRFKFGYITEADRSTLFNDGKLWREHRRLVLRALRDYGRGQTRSEDIILQETESLRRQLIQESGTPQNTRDILRISFAKILYIISFGHKASIDDEGTHEFLDRMHKLMSSRGFGKTLPFVVSLIISHGSLFLLPPLRWFSKLKEHAEWCQQFIKRKVDNHSRILKGFSSDDKDELRPPLHVDSDVSDLCENMLIEQRRRSSSGTSQVVMGEIQIVRTLLELFIAGTDTTAVTLSWAWVQLAFHEDIQKNVHKEIDRVIGQNRLPQMTDRLSCHYINAVLDEVLRVSSNMPFALPHRSTDDTVIHGFFIPKNSYIIPNLYAVHYDSKLWIKPKEFHPRRFLDPENGTYAPSEHLIAFGIGERACLGKSLAKMELFLFFTVLMQRLSVRLQKPHPPQDVMLSAKSGIIRYLCQHHIIFETRTEYDT